MSFSLLDLFALERTAPQLVTVQAQALARAVAESMGYVMSQSGVELRLSAVSATRAQ